MDLGEIHKIKITPKPSLIGHNTTQFLSRATVFPAQRSLLPNFSLFILLESFYYAAHQIMHSRRNCHKISRSLIYYVFSCRTLSILPNPISVFPNTHKTHTLGDFPVTLSIYYSLLCVHRSLRDAQQWQQAVLTRSPCLTQILPVFLPNIFPHSRIFNYCISLPPFANECLFFPLYSVSWSYAPHDLSTVREIKNSIIIIFTSSTDKEKHLLQTWFTPTWQMSARKRAYKKYTQVAGVQRSKKFRWLIEVLHVCHILFHAHCEYWLPHNNDRVVAGNIC